MNRKLISKLTKYIIFSVVTLLLINTIKINVYAADVNGSISSADAVLGETVTLTATMSSSSVIWGYDAYIQYDSTGIEFVSGSVSGGDVSGGNGRIRIYHDDGNSTNVSITLTFKAKQAGNYAVYFTADSSIYDENVDDMHLIASTGYINVSNQAPVSSDNTLSNLTVYIENNDGSTGPGWYWPQFSPDTTYYDLNVENNAKKLNITATASHSAATVMLSDTNLNVGYNTITITVKAEDGSTKQYVINVNKAAEETTEDESQETETQDTEVSGDNKVIIGSKEYSIVDYTEESDIPEGYEIIDYNYNGTIVKALKGLGTEIVLIGLTADGVNVEHFIYFEANNQFYKFALIGVKSAQYVILEMPSQIENVNIPSEYILSSIDINGNAVDVYEIPNTNICLVYAMNWNGEEGLYYYDKDNHTMMSYFAITGTDGSQVSGGVSVSPEDNNKVDELKKTLRIVVIVAIIVFLVMLAVVVGLMISNKNGEDEFEEEFTEDEDLSEGTSNEGSLTEKPEEPVAATEESVAVAEEPVAVAEEPVAVTEEPVAVAEEPVAVAEESVVVAEESVVVAEEPVAVAEEPVAVAEEPVAVTEEPVAVAEEPVAVAEEPVAVAEEPVAVAEEPVPVAEEVVAPEVVESIIKENKLNVEELLADTSTSLKEDELDKVLDDLFSDLLDGDN